MNLSPKSDPFASSSQAGDGEPDPAVEVDRIVEDASFIDQLSPSLEATINEHQASFFDTFHRQVELIKSRSQAFSDHHITVYDKVLLRLTQNGNILSHPAAIAYFCEEFLGVSPNSSPEHETLVVKNAVTASVIVSKALAPKDRVSSPLVESQQTAPRAFEVGTSTGSDPSFGRLWIVYENAKDEFFGIKDPNSEEKQKAARFLRDTAENVIQQLDGRVVDQDVVDDLKENFEIAKTCATTFFGGKKRKFDENHRPSNKRPHMYDSSATKSVSGHGGAVASREEGRRSGSTERCLSKVHEPGGSQRIGRSRDENISRSQLGRGHSGIPYGYSRRSVDSYQPGR